MTALPRQDFDRRRTVAVTEDAQGITDLAQTLQRHAIELNGRARKLRGTIEALEVANEELVRLRVAAAAALIEARDARLMAEHANNAKTLFLRGMSHELRTPLNVISAYAELLEEGIRGTVNPHQSKDLRRIKRAAAYLLRLINDVLTVARLEGARPLHIVAIAVNPVLAEVESLCAAEATAKGLTLSVVPSERSLLAMSDAERLQQILLNLVTNAIKFTTVGGSVIVTSDGDARMVRITVLDTGVGIRADDVHRVFEPFVQIDRNLTAPTEQGVGLGLSISRDLARAMHGELTLQSTEGLGCTFTLTLPVAVAAVPAVAMWPRMREYTARRPELVHLGEANDVPTG